MNTKQFAENEIKKEKVYNLLVEKVLTAEEIRDITGFKKSSVRFMLIDLERRENVIKTLLYSQRTKRHTMYFRATEKPFKRKTLTQLMAEYRSKGSFDNQDFFNPFVKKPEFPSYPVRTYSMDNPAAPYVPVKRSFVPSIASSFEVCI